MRSTNSFNCFFLAYTKLFQPCHSSAQEEEEERNFLAFISFPFFWLLMLLNCGKSLCLLSWEYFLENCHHSTQTPIAHCMNAVIANKFFNAMAFYMYCAGHKKYLGINFRVFLYTQLVLFLTTPLVSSSQGRRRCSLLSLK